MKLISIIVPVYNVEPYIKKCINSIMCQTYKKLQIILIDDGSTDGSGTICNRFSETDQRIEVIHQEHKGAADARNVGLCAAKGDYIGFVDSDDWCEPEMFSEMLKAMQENNADAVRCNWGTVKGNKSLPYISNKSEMSIVSGRDAILDTIYHTTISGFGTIVWNTLFKAEIVRTPEMLWFDCDMRLGEDADWLRRYLIRCEKVVLLPDCYYYYNKNNVSSITRNVSYQEQLLSADCTIEFLTDNHFPETAILHRKKMKEKVYLYKEINDYISNRNAHTPTIDKTSVIKDILMKNKWVLGCLKLSLVLIMIKVRMSPKLVEKIWGLHR